MLTKEEHERLMSLIRCNRCGRRMEREKFREEKLKIWWNVWCISCENTPIGQLPSMFGDD